jgi:hypothetical protein
VNWSRSEDGTSPNAPGGCGWARGTGCYPDAPPFEIKDPVAREAPDRGLGRTVDAEGRSPGAPGRGAREDDGAAIAHQRKRLLHGKSVPFTLTSNVRSKCSSVISPSGLNSPRPALAKRTIYPAFFAADPVIKARRDPRGAICPRARLRLRRQWPRPRRRVHPACGR